MKTGEASRKEYIYRINKVLDYIDAHIREELDLATLASVAGFSPFHFHRIFSALTGETLNNFIRRLRAEKAGRMLINFPDWPVSEIADICGYSSMPVFCRTFRDVMGISAQDFRDKKRDELSKISQSLSKQSQLNAQERSELCFVEPNEERKLFMKTNIEIKDMPELKVLYVRHTGPFDQIGNAYEKLMKWAGPRGLLASQTMKTVTIYHDDPAVTDIANLRQSACITIDREMKGEGEVGRIDIPSGRYAVGRFEIGVEGFSDAWNTMCQWFSESGYQPGEGMYYELYHNSIEQDMAKHFVLDICIPVKEL